MRGAFVILQIAASLVLLVGAGLFLRTLKNAYSVDLGYQLDQTLVASLNLEARGYFEGGSRGADAGLACTNRFFPASRRSQASSRPAPRA